MTRSWGCTREALSAVPGGSRYGGASRVTPHSAVVRADVRGGHRGGRWTGSLVGFASPGPAPAWIADRAGNGSGYPSRPHMDDALALTCLAGARGGVTVRPRRIAGHAVAV